MKCPHCGKDAGEARFCPYCGKQIRNTADGKSTDAKEPENLSLSEGENDRTLDEVKKDVRKDRLKNAGTGGLLFLAAIPYIFGFLIILFVSFVAPALGIPAMLFFLWKIGIFRGKDGKK